MAKEAGVNIKFVCSEHATKPNPRFTKKGAASFVGKFVKKGFDVQHPETNQPMTEHMWVKVTGVKNGDLVGELNNDPVGFTPLKCDDVVTVKLSEIEECLD